MSFNKRILVVINPNKDEQIALDKAIRLSESLGTKITALVRRKHAIPKLLATLEKKLSVAKGLGIEVAVQISDETNWFRAIIRAQHQHGFGLMVKEAHALSLTDHVFLPDDWKLLRTSHCPVLLVHADNDWRDKPILLCVDSNPVDGEHQALNARILTAGRFLAEVGNTQINLATSYPSTMQNASEHYQVPELLRAQYRTNCHKMLADDSLPESQIHVEQGPAELLIPQLADTLGAKLVILGTVARSGLRGILLGNTAEQILRRLDTDVLVLPPEH